MVYTQGQLLEKRKMGNNATSSIQDSVPSTRITEKNVAPEIPKFSQAEITGI